MSAAPRVFPSWQRWALRLAAFAWLAPLLALLAGWMLRAGFDPLQHTLASLGRVGAAQAGAFNMLAFVLPGLLLAAGAIALHGAWSRHDAGMPARIGLQALLIAALAFAAQGLWPFDPLAADEGTSLLHAIAYSLARVAWLVASMLAWSAARQVPGSGLLRWLVPLSIGVQLALVLLPPASLREAGFPVGVQQALGLLLWFGWPAWAAWAAASRRD